jgi:hypothetical protein
VSSKDTSTERERATLLINSQKDMQPYQFQTSIRVPLRMKNISRDVCRQCLSSSRMLCIWYRVIFEAEVDSLRFELETRVGMGTICR